MTIVIGLTLVVVLGMMVRTLAKCLEKELRQKLNEEETITKED